MNDPDVENILRISKEMSGDASQQVTPDQSVPQESDPDVQNIMNISAQMKQESQSKDPISLIHKYFPQSEWANAERVMMAESGGKFDAVGDNYPIRGQTIPSVGLFQIRTLPGRPSLDQLKDPELNVQYAAQMQKEQGWQPWTTARNMGLPGTTPIN